MGQGIVVGYFRASHLQRRIQHEERAPAIFNILLDRVHFRLLVIARWPRNYQRCAVARHCCCLQQVDGFRLVIIFSQQLLELGEPFAIAVVNLMFSAATYKANGPRRALQVADKGTGDAFFRHALGFFMLRANLHDCSAQIANSSFARLFRIFIWIHVLDVDFVRKIRVLLEQVLAFTKFFRLVEVGDGRVLLQTFDDLGGLVGKAVTLVRSRVIGLVVAIGKHIADGNNRDHNQDVHRRVSCVFCLPRFEPLASHLRPPPQ